MKGKLLWLVALIIFITLYSLFVIKYNSRQKSKELKRVEIIISEEEKRIQLLKIELAHRIRPQNLKEMLFLVPDLQPISPEQIITLKP